MADMKVLTVYVDVDVMVTVKMTRLMRLFLMITLAMA